MDARTLQAFNDGREEPDPDHLCFDLRKGVDSPWNDCVLRILVDEIKVARKASKYKIPKRSDAYLLDMVQERYLRARTSWKETVPRYTIDNKMETPGEVESRVLTEKEKKEKSARCRERRVAVGLTSS